MMPTRKIKIFLIVFICALSTSACFNRIPRAIKESFTFCFDGKCTGIRNLINIDGYFKERVLIKRSPAVGGFLTDPSVYYIDTFYSRFMFYDNGLFVSGLHDSYYDHYKRKRIRKDVSLLLKGISESNEAPGASTFYRFFWGSYIIRGDTIKTQEISQWRSLNAGWSLREDWYRVIDRNTIERIGLDLPVTAGRSRHLNRTNYPIVFVPIPAKPTPYYSWILKERWFWCNELDWKNFLNNNMK